MDLYLQSVAYHDLTVVVRKEMLWKLKVAGSKNVMRVYRS